MSKQDGSKKRVSAWLGVVLIALGLIGVGFAFKPAIVGDQTEAKGTSPDIEVAVATAATPLVEEPPEVLIKVRPVPRPIPARPQRIARAKPQVPKPAEQRAVPVPAPAPTMQSPKKRAYPKAEKRTAPPKASQERSAGGVIPIDLPKSRSSNSRPSPDEVSLEAQVSWDSLPASGSPTNGLLTFEIKPGRRQSEAKVKRNLVVLLDVSGSMRLPIEDIVAPVILLMNRLTPQDKGAVVTFSDEAKAFHAATTMPAYKREVKPLTDAPRTDLLVGMEAAVKEIKKGRFQNREDQLVVLTDGLTSGPGGRKTKAVHNQKLLELARASGIPITVFGYGGNCDHVLLTQLAQVSDGQFTYTSNVSQLLESVMGDVIGLSGAITRDNVLVLELKTDLKVKQAYLLGPGGRPLGQTRLRGNKLEIPLGTLSEGETIRVALEVVLPSGEVGTLEIADAKIRYRNPEGKTRVTPTRPINLQYTESHQAARRNRQTADVVPQIQQMSKGRR